MKVKPTKRPKRVSVQYEEIKSYTAKYDCPTCKTSFVGFGPNRNVVRFICKCGQELIVER